MLAETALLQSKTSSIESQVRNGLLIILRDENASGRFRLFFVPQDERETYDFTAGAVEVGLYDDLDTAVTIACIGYGAYEARWNPVQRTHLTALKNV